MAAAVGIKRLGFAAAVVAAAAVAALVILPWLLPAEAVRKAVQAEIRAVTGLDPVLRGEASVSLFPAGTVSFDDVMLGANTGAPALTAEHVVARLRFFPLLIGRIEIADVSLIRPTIAIIFNDDRSSNWSDHIETLARNLKSGPDRPASFSEIRITDGTVILRDEAYKILETISNVEMALAWPSISRSFAATGRFAWHDEPIDATVSLTDFAAALLGERSGIKLRLAGAPLKLAFDGYISHRPTLKMEGTLATYAVSLRDTLRWAGQHTPPGGGFGRFALKAQTNVVGGTISLSGVNIELDGNTGEGVLTFDGRQSLQGTLAAEGLDLTPYVSAVRLLAAGERGWDSKPIALDGLDGVQLDLRLSAARVNVANVKFGRTAVAANLRDGNLAVAVGESQAFGGVVRGTFGLAKSSAGTDFKAQLQFADVDLEQCLGEMFGIRRLEGKGNLGFAIESSGRSVYDLTKGLNGTASLASRKGAIAGFNVEQLLKRIERRPLSGSGEFRTGKTPYETLIVNLRITQGMANVEDVRMEGPNVGLALAGSASIPERDLDLRGTASLLATSTSGTAAPAFELPFMVQGPWDDPIILPDPQSRIQRSGAAQPILDAIRNRSLRDPVRSAIERLTGAAPAETPPAAAAPALAGSSAPADERPADSGSMPGKADSEPHQDTR
ncbi:MAG: cell envelope biogenesis protein AsmA [Alphaproteobacteria bacterium 13_2_20CM_2_64_7]|nr:MAG: cell envelope biogenesis protein AsmA [Alphaproteobacteria bacterium 13_2_20CM_2_64_7]